MLFQYLSFFVFVNDLAVVGERCVIITGVETVSESHGASAATYSDVESGNGQANYEKRNAGDDYYLFV